MAQVTASANELSPMKRVLAAFVAPTELFEDIRRNTSWWPPILLLTIFTLIFCFAVQKQVGWLHAYETILHQTPKQEERMQQMAPAQAANAKEIGAKITAVTSYGSPILILLISAIAAAVLLGTLNFGFGGTASYGQVFAVYLFASLPYVLHVILASIALFAGLDSGSFLISNPVGSNPGYYLPQDSAKWLIALASSIDLFTIWVIVLMVIGCAVVARVSRTSAAVAVVGWWFLGVVVKVGAAAIQS